MTVTVTYQIDVVQEALGAAVVALVQLVQHLIEIHRIRDHFEIIINL